MLVELSQIVCAIEPDWELLLKRKDFCTLVTFCNSLTIRHLHKNPDFLVELAEFDFVFADGMLLAVASGISTGRHVKRFSFDGNSLAVKVLEEALRGGCGIVLVGGKPGVSAKAAQVLEQADFHVLSTHSGYFKDKDEKLTCIEDVAKSGAGIVLVGMGGLRQEKFALALKRSGFKGIVVTCGGYFDQLSQGKLAYYPSIINTLNLRALYRVTREPIRLIPRYTIGYLPFYIEFLGLISNAFIAKIRRLHAKVKF